MTGGYPKAKTINGNLAAAAAELQLGLGVGSQRPALEDKKHVDTYTVIKDFDVPLVIGNIGLTLIDKNLYYGIIHLVKTMQK